MPKTMIVAPLAEGLPAYTAVTAARAGWNVVGLTSKADLEPMARLAAAQCLEERIHLRPAHLGDPASVTATVNAAAVEFSFLDALVNTADLPHLGTLEWDGPQAARAALEANFFAVLHATAAALPHLRQAAGRIVTFTNTPGHLTAPFQEAYSAARYAVEGYMEAFAPVAAAGGVQVALLDTGRPVHGGLTAPERNRLLQGAGVYRDALTRALGLGERQAKPPSPVEVGEAVVRLLHSPRMPRRAHVCPQSAPPAASTGQSDD